MSTPPPAWRRFVAVGDSITEGLADFDADGHAVGWADRLAQQLANQCQEPIRYANLAVRGRTVHAIVEQQVPAAQAMKPDLVSIWGGGNDMLRSISDPDHLARKIEQAVAGFREAGVDVLLGSGIDTKGTPIIGLDRGKVALYTLLLSDIAHRYGAHLIDLWSPHFLQDRRMWFEDRVHFSTDAHRRIADAALTALGLPAPDPHWAQPLPPLPPEPRHAALRRNIAWAREHALPWIGRRLRGTDTGTHRFCKQPDYRLVHPIARPGGFASAQITSH